MTRDWSILLYKSNQDPSFHHQVYIRALLLGVLAPPRSLLCLSQQLQPHVHGGQHATDACINQQTRTVTLLQSGSIIRANVPNGLYARVGVGWQVFSSLPGTVCCRARSSSQRLRWLGEKRRHSRVNCKVVLAAHTGSTVRSISQQCT
jgi:hypothetical protein